jgi:hypothetical protein
MLRRAGHGTLGQQRLIDLVGAFEGGPLAVQSGVSLKVRPFAALALLS